MTISLPPRTKVVGGEGRVSEDMGGGVVVAGGAGCAAGDYPVGPKRRLRCPAGRCFRR